MRNALSNRYVCRFRLISFHILAILFTGCIIPSSCASAALAMPQDAVPLRTTRETDTLLAWLDKQAGTIIAMQRDLVAHAALNPEHGGTGEGEKLEWVENRLRSYGMTDVLRLDSIDPRVPGQIRGNLVAKWAKGNPTRAERPTLWLLSHLDVFPAGPAEDWQGDPFTLRVEGDLLHGRGVEDNNQAIVCSLLLVEALHATGITGEADIGLVFCSGALTNYDINIKHILGQKPDLFFPNDLILLMDYGNPAGSFIQVGEKGNAWLKFTVTGRESHASSPHQAVNALAVGAEFIHALRELQQVFPARDTLFTPPESTFSPTISINYGKAANHIPGKFEFYVDARLLPEYSYEQLETAVRELADQVGEREQARIDFVITERTPFAPTTPTDSRIIRLLARAIETQLGVRPTTGGVGSVTMASAIRERGFDVAVWAIQKNWHNKAREYASIADHIRQTKVLVQLALDPETARTPRMTNGAPEGGDDDSSAH